MKKIDEIKRYVLTAISHNRDWYPLKRNKFRIDNYVIHLRFCSTDKLGTSKYKFNINPNTLNSNYEVWICGNRNTYYFIPIKIIQKMYNDPDAYIDRRHPKIRIVTVNIKNNNAWYARVGKKINLTPYFCGTLK